MVTRRPDPVKTALVRGQGQSRLVPRSRGVSRPCYNDGRRGDGDPIGMLRCWPLATHSGRRPVSEIWKGNSAIADHALPESLTIDGLCLGWHECGTMWPPKTPPERTGAPKQRPKASDTLRIPSRQRWNERGNAGEAARLAHPQRSRL